jgi:hypothetical protein
LRSGFWERRSEVGKAVERDSHRATALKEAQSWKKLCDERDRLVEFATGPHKAWLGSGTTERIKARLEDLRLWIIRHEERLGATMVEPAPAHLTRNGDGKPVIIYCSGKTYRCVEEKASG